MNPTASAIRLLLLGALLAGCGLPPLFEHADAPESEERTQAPVSSKCPIRFSELGYCASLTWISAASETEGGVLSLKFWSPPHGSAQGPYETPPGSPHVYLWMPEHGHGSSPVEIEPETGSRGHARAGRFRLSEVFFIMPGNWDIHIQVKNGSRILEEESVRYVAR